MRPIPGMPVRSDCPAGLDAAEPHAGAGIDEPVGLTGSRESGGVPVQDHTRAGREDTVGAPGQPPQGSGLPERGARQATAPYRVGHHACAVRSDGRLLVHPGMAGQVLADFPQLKPVDGELVQPDPEDGGLAEAIQWAFNVLDTDEDAAAVRIRQSIQPYEGGMWREGRYVTTLGRMSTTCAPPASEVSGRDCNPEAGI